MDEELWSRRRGRVLEEVLVAWIKSLGAGGGAGGLDEKLWLRGAAGGVDFELVGGRRCWWHG